MIKYDYIYLSLSNSYPLFFCHLLIAFFLKSDKTLAPLWPLGLLFAFLL